MDRQIVVNNRDAHDSLADTAGRVYFVLGNHAELDAYTQLGKNIAYANDWSLVLCTAYDQKEKSALPASENWYRHAGIYTAMALTYETEDAVCKIVDGICDASMKQANISYEKTGKVIFPFRIDILISANGNMLYSPYVQKLMMRVRNKCCNLHFLLNNVPDINAFTALNLPEEIRRAGEIICL